MIQEIIRRHSALDRTLNHEASMFNSDLGLPRLNGEQARQLPLVEFVERVPITVFQIDRSYRIPPRKGEGEETILFIVGSSDGLTRENLRQNPHPNKTKTHLPSLHLIKPERHEVFGLESLIRAENRAHKAKGYGKILFQEPSTISTLIKNVAQLIPEVKTALRQSPQKIADAIKGFQHSLSGAFSEKNAIILSLPRAALIALTVAYLGVVASSVAACAPPATPDHQGIKTEQAVKVPASVKFNIKPELIPFLENVLEQPYKIKINGQEYINPGFEALRDNYFSRLLAEQMIAIDRQFPNDKGRITVEPSGISSVDGYTYSFFLDGHEMAFTGYNSLGHNGFFTFIPEGAKHLGAIFQFPVDGNRYSTIFLYAFEDKNGIVIDPDTNIYFKFNYTKSNLDFINFYEKSKANMVNILRNMSNLNDGRGLKKARTEFEPSYNEQGQVVGTLKIISIDDGSIIRLKVGSNGRVDPVPLP